MPRPTFRIVEDAAAIECLICGRVSREPEHVRLHYCPACATWHEEKPRRAGWFDSLPPASA